MANSYVDDIKVKVSEKSKPLCKVSMPVSYFQRLNTQFQDNRPQYDFSLEKSVIKKMKELKEIRKILVDKRKERLLEAKKKFDEQIQEEKLDRIEKEQAQARLLEESSKATTTTTTDTVNYISYVDQTFQSYQNSSRNLQNPQNFITSNGILVPTPAADFSKNVNILTPVPLQNTLTETQKSPIKSFNLSDFESDTSSPFDNMELKSINDLEELAEVLKSNRNNFEKTMYQNTSTTQHSTPFSNYSKSFNQVPVQPSGQNLGAYGHNILLNQGAMGYNQNLTISQDSTNYTQLSNNFNTKFNPISTTFSQFNTPYSTPSTVSYNLPNTVSNYSNLNGYYYPNPSNLSHMHLNQPPVSYTPCVSTGTQPILQKSSCKSVPDLVKSLEQEIDNTHLSDNTDILKNTDPLKNQNYRVNKVPVPSRPKSTDAIYPKSKTKDEFFGLFDKLTTEQKEMCKNVSMMGFPLDRVARVCLIVENDHKKLVDHLLALTDLLDLGFSEKDASEALLKNNNDRDKALDLLIS